MKPSTPSIKDLTQLVCDRFGVKPADLKLKTKVDRISTPRQVAMYLIRTTLGLTTEVIGAEFGKEHSTVSNSVRAVKDRMEVDRRFRATIQALQTSLKAQC